MKIKVRAFDRETGEFIYSEQDYDEAWFDFKDGTLKGFAIHGETAGSLYEPPEPNLEELEEVQLFTGLYDATTWDELTEDERAEWTRSGNMPSEWKGKPIYEGDRIKLLYNWHEQYWTVKFTKGCFYLFRGDRLSMLYNFDAFEMEIIGNIWENHELLEGKNGEY